KPGRHEWLIQRSIDPNNPVLLLNCAKDEIFLGTMLSPAPPHHFVITKTPAKISFVQLLKHWAQVEMRPLVKQIQLPLHRQLRVRELSLRLFLFSLSHLLFPQKNQQDAK